jgi:hypothetical protein
MRVVGSDDNFSGLSPEERAALELESALTGARERWGTIDEATINAPQTITTETEAENFTTVVAQLQALLKRVDQVHDDVKEPYLTAGRKVDGMTAVLRDRIVDRKVRLETTLTRYQVAKQRAIDEERERLRQLEAEDPEPAIIPHRQTDSKRSRVRSLEGAVAHLTTEIDIEIVDVSQIPPRYLNRPRVLAALRSEILPDVRKGDDVPGVNKIDGLKSRVKA